ncbi:hypothetical protein NIES2101_24000 [Calothrix sp. HK-06]|nr:hypothetical protein NIES2101_23865 [Calothrix sp. HK-06]OKH47331.1 hypothetical protein NIES2101_24000 [Calothrix sp. HK-06]
MQMNTQKIVAADNAATKQKDLNDLNTSNTFNSNIEKPDNIDINHWEEWISSGVKPDIIKLNIRSIHDAREVDKILSRNSKKRWKHSSELVPCWQVSGLDPTTGEATLKGVQVKPDTSPLNKDGRIQKYIGASGYGACPLFLDTGVEGYWQSVIDNSKIPLLITEGAKKAASLLSIGYASVSIPGVSTCRKNGRLHHWLQPVNGFGRKAYLCFDNDVLSKKAVQDALLAMSRELASSGSKVMVIKLPSGVHKGVDDFIAANGKEAFDKLVEEALTIEEWRLEIQEQWKNQEGYDEDERQSRLYRYMDVVRQGWGDALRLNKLKNIIELHGAELDLNLIRLRIALEFDIDIPIGDAQAVVEMVASENSYHPVVDYIDTLSLVHPNIDTSILDNLATRYFGSDNPIHNIYMKRCLVAAVARLRQPGCKHDTATILVGKQGTGKSTFWKVLFGEDWFSDELGDANERDELMKLHRFWGLEWSEFETVYRKKDVSALKKFMSSTTDAFRTPYSRVIKEFPRASVLIGTTNEQEILADATGSRRFWIIPIVDTIPIELVQRERDKLWAAASALYQQGVKWYLSPEEQEQQQEANLEFQVQDPWLEPIANFIRGRDYATTTEILNALGVETARAEVGMSKRVGCVMRQLKWTATRRRINGENLRCWTPSDKKFEYSSGTPGTPGTTSEKNAPDNKNSSGTPLKTEILVEHPQTHTRQDVTAINQEGVPGVPLEKPTFLFSTCNFEKNAVGFDPSLSADKKASFKKTFNTPQGVITITGTLSSTDKWHLLIEYPNKAKTEETLSGNKKTIEARLFVIVETWHAQFRYTVQQLVRPGAYNSIANCRLLRVRTNPSGKPSSYLFQPPDNKAIWVHSHHDFSLED